MFIIAIYAVGYMCKIVTEGRPYLFSLPAGIHVWVSLEPVTRTSFSGRRRRDVTGRPCCRCFLAAPRSTVRRVLHLPCGTWQRWRHLATADEN